MVLCKILMFFHWQHTVPTIPVWTKPVLCTNLPKITMLFYYLKVPKDFSPLGPTLALTGALKWGTVRTSTSTLELWKVRVWTFKFT